jgi:hypothetical protein
MNHPASSFGSYESIRIFAPGFYFAALLMSYLWAGSRSLFPPFELEGIPLFFIFLAVAMVSGLTLYAKESTKRRKAFLENQPSLWIKNRARAMTDLAPLEDAEARRLYFYILNNHMPSVFHEKIFFFGTIYHIMIQIRRTSFWFALLSAATFAFAIATGWNLPDLRAMTAFTIVVWFIYSVNVRYNKADRKMQENYQDQIYWLEMNSDLVEGILRKRYSTPAGRLP